MPPEAALPAGVVHLWRPHHHDVPAPRAVLGFDRFDTLVALLESTREALLKDVAGG